MISPLAGLAVSLLLSQAAPTPLAAPAGLTPARLAALEQRLRVLSADGSASYGIVFKDLTGGASVRIAGKKVFHAASTMKTAVMLEVLRRVDEGTLSLEQEVPVANGFASALDGSPYQVSVEADEEKPTALRLGASAPLSFLVDEMIVRSSNLATNLVLGLVGPGSVQRLLDELGAPSVKVRRGVEDEKAFQAGFSNETDADGMATLMEAVVSSPRLSEKARATAFRILARQTINDQIPAGLPGDSGAIVAHKTGSISTVQHDAAVVRLPDGRTFVLVLLAGGFGGTEEGRQRVYETTRRMARAAWEAMTAP